MKLLLTLLLAVLLPWLMDGLLPPAPGDLAVPLVEPAAPGDGDTGHGAYCELAEEPALFLGRDVPELGTYQAFQGWCEARGGTTRWSA